MGGCVVGLSPHPMHRFTPSLLVAIIANYLSFSPAIPGRSHLLSSRFLRLGRVGVIVAVPQEIAMRMRSPSGLEGTWRARGAVARAGVGVGVGVAASFRRPRSQSGK